jgi:nucleoid DNA-binding protein
MIERETIIGNYIDAYNRFDVERMVKNFHEEIRFENINQGKVTLSLSGLSAFKEQANEARHYFSVRKQTPRSFRHHKNSSEVDLDYYAILAIDLPNGLKKGDELKLRGRSVFTFTGTKIIMLTDIS